MKKLLAMACVMTLAVTTLTGCGSKKDTVVPETTDVEETVVEQTTEETEEATEATEEATSEEGRTFTVGFDAEFPPYGYADENGEYVGFDLSLAEEVCARLGWELVKQPIAWDAKDMELSSGAIDCIWNGFTLNGREDDYTWTVPYVDNSQVFVVSADANVTTKEGLAGLSVGVQKDSAALAALDEEENAELKASFAELIEYGDYNTAFMDMEAGAIDAVAMDIGVADYQISQRAGQYVIIEEPLAVEQYAVGFLLGNEELRDTVQATLLEMVEDGTFAAIAEEWGLADSVCLGK